MPLSDQDNALSKYSRLILHTALVSPDKDNDSGSMALGGKLSCQVWSFPITDFSKRLFEKGEVGSLSRSFSTGNKGAPKDPLADQGMLWENPDTSPQNRLINKKGKFTVGAQDVFPFPVQASVFQPFCTPIPLGLRSRAHEFQVILKAKSRLRGKASFLCMKRNSSLSLTLTLRSNIKELHKSYMYPCCTTALLGSLSQGRAHGSYK